MAVPERQALHVQGGQGPDGARHSAGAASAAGLFSQLDSTDTINRRDSCHKLKDLAFPRKHTHLTGNEIIKNERNITGANNLLFIPHIFTLD